MTLVHPLSVENFYAPLVEHWNGAQWKVVKAAPGVRGTLSSVSCTAASTCTAVGDLDNGTQALVQTPSGWAGESLSLPHPDALTFTVEHVSCSDATTCTAVGRSDVAGTNTPFIAARSTGGWSSSDAAFGTPLLQSSVSCATTDHCVITTTTSQATGSLGHAYTSTGLTLTPLTLTNPQGNPDGSLRAVSCISSGFCAAASNLTVDTSMLVTSGGDWVPTPSDQPSDAVADISCVTATFCLAVGYDPVSQQTSSLQWDGSRWNNVPVPVGQAGDQGRLLRVSCSSTTWCMALGIVDQSPIVLTWNGTTWTPDDSFTVPDKTTLGGVSCTSANWCVVVGASGVGRAHLHPIIATFDGTSWHHMSGVTPAIPSTALSGVSCTSSRWCMVVGQIGRRATTSGSTSIKARAFAEVWNGKRWSRAPVDISLRVFNPMSVLNDSMSCTGRAACMMTGWEWAVAWDGNGWAPTRPPRSERRSAGLEDVSCTSGLSCVGVGWSWRDWSWEYKGVMVPLIVTSST